MKLIKTTSVPTPVVEPQTSETTWRPFPLSPLILAAVLYALNNLAI